MEPGQARDSFIAVFGLWSGIWFLFAVAFDTIMVFWVPVCGLD